MEVKRSLRNSTGIWIWGSDGKPGTAVKRICCRNEPSERSMWQERWDTESSNRMYERCGIRSWSKRWGDVRGEKDYSEMVWSHSEDEEQKVCGKKCIWARMMWTFKQELGHLEDGKARWKNAWVKAALLEGEKCLDRERCRLFCHGYPHWENYHMRQGIRGSK